MVNKPNASLQAQYGLAYLAVLFLIVAISISMAVVSQNEDLQLKREKEQDWLFIGQQYQHAIGSYYQQSPNGLKSLPMQLDELLLDTRFIKPVRHLRKLYTDPVNFNQRWQAIVNDEGKITGVVSESQQAILVTNALAERIEAGAPANYASVRFEYKSQAEPALNHDDDSDTLQQAGHEGEIIATENEAPDDGVVEAGEGE